MISSEQRRPSLPRVEYVEFGYILTENSCLGYYEKEFRSCAKKRSHSNENSTTNDRLCESVCSPLSSFTKYDIILNKAMLVCGEKFMVSYFQQIVSRLPVHGSLYSRARA